MLNVNFLPEAIKLQRARRKRLVRQGYLVAGCICAMIFLGYVRQGSISEAKAELAHLQQRSGNMQRQLESRQKLEKELAELMLMKQVDDTLGSRVIVVDVLAELARLAPPSVTLTDLKLETMEVALVTEPLRRTRSARPQVASKKEKTTVKRLQVIITGVAPGDVDVANFIGLLSASPLLEDVNMGYAKTVPYRDRQVREFQVGCYVVR